MIFLADGNIPPSHTSLAEEDIGTDKKPLYLYRRNYNEDPTPPSDQLEALQKVINQYKDEVDRIISSREFRSAILQTFAKRTSETTQIVVTLADQLVSDHEHLSRVSSELCFSKSSLTYRYMVFDFTSSSIYDFFRHGQRWLCSSMIVPKDCTDDMPNLSR